MVKICAVNRLKYLIVINQIITFVNEINRKLITSFYSLLNVPSDDIFSSF